MVFALPPTSFNLAAYVLARAAETPNKTALAVVGNGIGERLSYRELEQAVRGTATGLLAAGLEPGDRVLLRLGNSPNFPIAFLGCICAGIVAVPTSAQLTSTEISVVSEDLRPAAIIAADGVPLPNSPVSAIGPATFAQFRDLAPADYAIGDPNRAAYIIYSSGTSGTPRGVIHAHRAIWARQMMMQDWYGLRQDDRVMHAGAFNWTYTLGTGLLDPWTIGATALIPAANTPAADIPDLLQENDASIFAAAPGIYRQILKSDVCTIPTLRHALSAGEKLPEEIRIRWQDQTGTEIHEAYGMSECSTFISGNSDNPAAPHTFGRPQNGRRIALLDEDGNTQDTGQIAVHTSDPGLMLGYLNAPEDMAARFKGDWFLTGDIGTRLPSGDIRYEGRVDDMMNAGGFRVSPLEVETALCLHPDVQEAAAVELNVRSDASVIAAFYTAADVIDEGELNAHCATNLARYKTPRLFIRCHQLPRGANNKLLRRALRSKWEAEHGQT